MHYWPDNGSAGNAEACPGVKMDRAAPQFDVVPGCSTIFMLQTLRINMDTIGGVKDSRIPYLYRRFFIAQQLPMRDKIF